MGCWAEVSSTTRSAQGVAGGTMVQHSSKRSRRRCASHASPPWARVALIAASTEPADCTRHPRPASKKAHAQLYEIFIHCVHFSSFSYSPPCPPFPFSFSSATKQTRKTSPSRVFRLDFLPGRKRSSISLAVASLLCLPGAKKLGTRGRER